MLIKRGQPGLTLLLIRCTLLLWITLHTTFCVAQGVTDGRHFRDSLYQHISEGGKAALSCRFAYSQSSSEIIPSLDGNDHELARLDSFLRVVSHHPTLLVNRIRLTGYSSIEGRYQTNEQLAKERVESFYRYLRMHYPGLSHHTYDIAWVAEDWLGLAELVRNSNVNGRDEVLEIIRKIGIFDGREGMLMRLNGGRPYREMEQIFFPQLRRVEIEIEYIGEAKPLIETFEPTDTPQIFSKEREQEVTTDYDSQGMEEVVLPATSPSRQPPTTSPLRGTPPRAGGELAAPRFALKTNVLLWAGVQHDFKHTTPTSNVALEYYFTGRWSVELGAMYSYWRYNSNREFQGISGYRLEPRYWFLPSDGRLGMFIGLYGRVGDYDRRTYKSLDPHGDLEVAPCHTGDYWDAGLSAGLYFGLVGNLGVEFGARAGYVSTNAIKYTMDNQYNWYDSEKQYNKFKVTDLNISLTYRFR